MKKLLLFAMAFVTMNVFAATNLFDASQASVLSTWGAGDINPTATWEDAQLNIDLNTDQAGWQWGNQVALSHNVNFEAGKYYQVSMTFLATADCGGVTLKMDDNTGMLYEDQTINLVANTALNYVSKVVGGAPGNNKAVFDFGHGTKGTHITISNITIVETEAPAIDYCDGAFVSNSEQQAAKLGADGNLGTRWESKSGDGDDIIWQMNLEEAVEFDHIKITWEGAYGKSFSILAGDDCESLVEIAKVEDQTLAGFPYAQVLELNEAVSAKHIRFQGIKRGTVYGYSFYEFEVYKAEVSVLTSLDFTASANICKIGETVNLTATPKDQYGTPMLDQTITYTVTPAAAGTVTNNVFTAQQAGLTTITATCGSLSKSVEVFNYAGENVALNKTVTAESDVNNPQRVNDGNNGTEFQVDPNDGKSGHDVTCGFVIDLGEKYDLSLVTILFEGACSQEYTLQFAGNSQNYQEAYSYSGNAGIWGHTDFLFGENLLNAQNVRYIKFESTKNATDWGCKIFELKAFGVASTPTAVENNRTVEGSAKTIENGRVVIIREGIRYDLNGRAL